MRPPTVAVVVAVFAIVRAAEREIVVVAVDESVLAGPAVTPDGAAIVAVLFSVAVPLEVPLIVKVTEPPEGSVGTVVARLLLAAIAPPHAAPPVGEPHVMLETVIAAGIVSPRLVPFAADGPLFVTTIV